MIPSIPVRRNRNEPFHLNSNRNFQNLGHYRKHLGDSVKEFKMTRAISIGWLDLIGKCSIFCRYSHRSLTSQFGIMESTLCFPLKKVLPALASVSSYFQFILRLQKWPNELTKIFQSKTWGSNVKVT